MNKHLFINGRKFRCLGDVSEYHYENEMNAVCRDRYRYLNVETITDLGFLAVTSLLGNRRSAWIRYSDLILTV